MGEKRDEFRTRKTLRECGIGFRDAIESGRGLSSKIGGLTATLMGGKALNFYEPQSDDIFEQFSEDPPDLVLGVAVPKAQGAHAKGTNVHMSVWDCGEYREVALWAHHSLTGGAHAQGLVDAVPCLSG